MITAAYILAVALLIALPFCFKSTPAPTVRRCYLKGH